jgi:hypothetical protein
MILGLGVILYKVFRALLQIETKNEFVENRVCFLEKLTSYFYLQQRQMICNSMDFMTVPLSTIKITAPCLEDAIIENINYQVQRAI